MGLVENKNGFWDYVSENGIKYELLEGKTIGGNETYTSDICFIMLDDSDATVDEITEDDRFVGFMYGATFLNVSNTRDEYVGYIKGIVDTYEEKHPDIVEKFSEKHYTVHVERYGYLLVTAKDEKEAWKKAMDMDEEEIHWRDGVVNTAIEED